MRIEEREKEHWDFLCDKHIELRIIRVDLVLISMWIRALCSFQIVYHYTNNIYRAPITQVIYCNQGLTVSC